MLQSNEIVTMLERQTVLESELMQRMLSERKDEVVSIAGEDFKSLIVTPTAMYLSPIATVTLKKKTINGLSTNKYGL